MDIQSLLPYSKDIANIAENIDALMLHVLIDLDKVPGLDDDLKRAWKKNHQDYESLIVASSKTAADGVSYFEEFENAVIPVIKGIKGPEDVDGRIEAVKALKDFLQSRSENVGMDLVSKRAEEFGDLFQRCREESQGFVGMFYNFFTRRWEETSNRLAEGDHCLEELKKEVGTGLPGWIDGFPGLFAGLDILEKQRRVGLDKIERVRDELNHIQREEEILEHMRERLGQSGELLKLTQDLDKLRHYWMAVSAEAYIFHKILESFVDSGNDGYITFRAHVSRFERVYLPLRFGFAAYVKRR